MQMCNVMCVSPDPLATISVEERAKVSLIRYAEHHIPKKIELEASRLTPTRGGNTPCSTLHAPRRLHHHKKLLTVIISALHRVLIRILGVADSFFRGWGPGGMRRR